MGNDVEVGNLRVRALVSEINTACLVLAVRYHAERNEKVTRCIDGIKRR